MQIVEIMEKTFQAESGDIALYLAMSQKATDEGHSDIALYLYNVAMDEARHAAEFALLLGKAYQYFEISMHDERRHKAGLKVILSKLQEKD